MVSEPVRECLVIFISSLMLMVHLKQHWTSSTDVLEEITLNMEKIAKGMIMWRTDKEID